MSRQTPSNRPSAARRLIERPGTRPGHEFLDAPTGGLEGDGAVLRDTPGKAVGAATLRHLAQAATTRQERAIAVHKQRPQGERGRRREPWEAELVDLQDAVDVERAQRAVVVAGDIAEVDVGEIPLQGAGPCPASAGGRLAGLAPLAAPQMDELVEQPSLFVGGFVGEDGERAPQPASQRRRPCASGHSREVETASKHAAMRLECDIRRRQA